MDTHTHIHTYIYTHTYTHRTTTVTLAAHARRGLTMDDNCGEWVECTGVASGCG